MILLRALSRLVAFLLLVTLSLVGLAAAVFSLRGEDRPLSLPDLADNLRLPDLRDTVGDFLGQLEAPGPAAFMSGLGGLAAIVLGILLLIGALAARRERLVVLEKGSGATLAARRRPLGQIVAALADGARGVVTSKARVRARRRGVGGRVDVTALHPRNRSPEQVKDSVRGAIAPISEAFRLRTRVRARLGEKGSRVE